VAVGADLFEAGSGRGTEGVTLLGSRITELVDLTVVPALPASAIDNRSCQFAEDLS
jgi:hypothetical protein